MVYLGAVVPDKTLATATYKRPFPSYQNFFERTHLTVVTVVCCFSTLSLLLSVLSCDHGALFPSQ
ncbi:hypothetical protein Plhal304r1_c002g0006661 [Plasmopara halstedii]